MNLHEYQAKELLTRFQVPVQAGIACTSIEEAKAAYRDISTRTNSRFVVIKAQIHAGGRGKGTFKEVPEQHGVQVVKSEEMAEQVATNMLGNTLVTLQTGEAGKVVNKIFLAEDAYYEGPNPQKEFYLSILL
ncbi:MAG: succinate--CoA ligase subunit beta, partial [Chitinophagaceae bacterium]|nr:succinate--CoA ligase subunit beta [Chitinophagaceae bacterium]